MMHGMGGYGQMMGGYPYAWLYVCLLLLVVIALLIFILVRLGGSRRRNGEAGHDSPEAILKRRYARGEISREEYERFKKDLDL